jgi:hypothetical protein
MIPANAISVKTGITVLFIKQYVEENQIKVEYIKTTDMVADIFTKPLQG